jgi:hypothetical protein
MRLCSVLAWGDGKCNNQHSWIAVLGFERTAIRVYRQRKEL